MKIFKSTQQEITLFMALAKMDENKMSNRDTIAMLALFQRSRQKEKLDMTMSELSACCGHSTANTTQMADKLEALGLVRREFFKGDRRKIAIVLTHTGDKVIKSILASIK